MLVATMAGPMVKKNAGNFVVVASMAAIVGAPAMADYSASKASAKAFCEALALELKHLRADKVNVTCICPSHVNTQLFGGFNTGPGSKSLLLEAKDVADATVEVRCQRCPPPPCMSPRRIAV